MVQPFPLDRRADLSLDRVPVLLQGVEDRFVRLAVLGVDVDVCSRLTALSKAETISHTGNTRGETIPVLRLAGASVGELVPLAQFVDQILKEGAVRLAALGGLARSGRRDRAFPPLIRESNRPQAEGRTRLV